ncbi:hypothetical protein [Falsiroseomonas sp.]|uniref:hypothetical protein n=1 Tax=Falsiroseomonas sp. TaxID=2870721 RepID=UPI0027374CBB|nr:hypothetical protein [Falsiroseomonas sp.]
MDDETRSELQMLRSEVRMASMFMAQSLAILAADDPAKRDTIDATVTHFEAIAESPGAKAIMRIIRDAHDKMAAGFRSGSQGREPRLDLGSRPG